MRRVVGLAVGWFLALSLAGSGPASAALDVVRHASCSGQFPVRARLELTDQGDRIKVRLEVHGPTIQPMDYAARMRHNGDLFLRAMRVGIQDGDVAFQRRVRDRDGTDWFRARALIGLSGDVGDGTVCTAHAGI